MKIIKWLLPLWEWRNRLLLFIGRENQTEISIILNMMVALLLR